MPWLTAKALFGLRRWIWLIIVFVVIALAWITIGNVERADDVSNQTIGATGERVRSLEENAARTETGNAAREEIRAPDRVGACARFNQCLRSARPGTSESCGRFLPELSTGFGCPGPN